MGGTFNGCRPMRRTGAYSAAPVTHGEGDVKSMLIDLSLLKPEVVEILREVIVAALRDARTQVEAAVGQKMQAVTVCHNLNAGMKLQF